MIDGSEKGNRQLAFELQNSHVREKRSKFFLLVFCYVYLCVDCVSGLLGCQEPENNTIHLS